MAFAKTMSNNPTDHWNLQSYQTNYSTTTQTPPETATQTNSTTTTTSRNNNLVPDQGRVSKPIRRRSRASRRTPTTLLSTDATNFRAMVQHFTGGPALQQVPAGPPFFNGGGGGVGNFGFTTQHVGAPGGGSGFQVQYPNQSMQEHVFMFNDMGGGGRGGGGASHAPTGNENRDLDNNYML